MNTNELTKVLVGVSRAMPVRMLVETEDGLQVVTDIIRTVEAVDIDGRPAELRLIGAVNFDD